MGEHQPGFSTEYPGIHVPMKVLKPKEQHEQMLAVADKQKIAQYLTDGQEQNITKIAVILARQCILLVHFIRLWQLRVADLDPQLNSESYMHYIYGNRKVLYKTLIRDVDQNAHSA